MTVADYIVDFLQKKGIKHVFLITGGAIAFVVDGFSKRKDISYICVSHEQAAAMGADAYSRLGPNIAATMVTSGPGATNLITGMCCSWFDSIPTIHITGQVNTFEQKGQSKVRQVGFQETDIISIIKPITTYQAQLTSPKDIRFVLEKAVFMAQNKRGGPVVIDIPQNFQRQKIDPTSLPSFTPPVIRKDIQSVNKKIGKILNLLTTAKRPVLLCGGGIRLAKAEKSIKMLSDMLQIPVVTSWSGFDLFAFDNPLRIGEIGVYGSRAANFCVQNADVIISIGSRLDTRQTGGKPETFARAAKLIMIDIDKAELKKRRGITPFLEIEEDAKVFIDEMIKQIHKNKIKLDVSHWLSQCRMWKEKYPAVEKKYYKEKHFVNPYVFIQTLSRLLDKNAVIIPDDGAHLTWTMQAFALKEGQRLFSAFGNSPMGYAFPAAIGASCALGKKEIICIDGDGSFQINIQELQTVAFHKLPIKVFILNNQGYGIIKQFQELYLGGRFEASGKGYSSPDFIKIAKAYNIKTVEIKNHDSLTKKIQEVLQYNGPVVCNVSIKPNQKIIPKLEFGKPIEDMTPYLPRKEFLDNMIIPTLDNAQTTETGV